MRLKLLLAYVAASGFLALFLWAGFWQLRRASEKDALFAAWAQVEQLPSLPFDQARAQPISRDHLLRTVVRGRYLPGRNILLDNQQRPGQIGVVVYTPFAVDGSAELLLVARGFIAVPRDRSSFPDPPVPGGATELHGLLVAPPAAGLNLAGAAVATQWPLLVTAIDPAVLAQPLGHALLPSVLLLDAAAPDGFVRDWHPNTLPPDRHRGYALQWFGLAATVLVVTTVLTFRTQRRRTP